MSAILKKYGTNLLMVLMLVLSNVAVSSADDRWVCGTPAPTPEPIKLLTPTSQIIIEDADTIWNTSIVYSSDLIDTASNVTPRVLSEYANTIYKSNLILSTDLVNVTSSVTPRITAEYANTIYRNDLNEIPTELANLIEEAPPKKLIIEYANSNYYKMLIFPKELINDTTPPIISNITVTNITENSATIKWDTDEFADSLVKYGTSSGAYTKQEYDELFVKKHSVSLYNLSPGTKYYFVVKSVDLSGNSAESSEYSFTTSGALNQPPIASFTYCPENPIVNQAITFNASSSYDPDGKITNYEWDFGDGNITSTTEEIIKHSYSEAGNYEVTLTVTDDKGATNSITKIITVYSQAIFDTGTPSNPYPSIAGTHNGTIKPNHTIVATKLYTYPCAGTGGHAEYARIYNDSWSIETLPWEGYGGDWHNLSFTEPFKLYANVEYKFTIITGSYPQIHHNKTLQTQNGWINCTSFVDANGRKYNDWIPAIRLEWEVKNESRGGGR